MGDYHDDTSTISSGTILHITRSDLPEGRASGRYE